MQTQRVPSFQIVLTLFCSFDRCEDGRTVYLKDGFWGGLNKRGDLVTYFCSFQYCNCTSTPGLPGCLFDPNNIDRQCADNREGWLCGKCSRYSRRGIEVIAFRDQGKAGVRTPLNEAIIS